MSRQRSHFRYCPPRRRARTSIPARPVKIIVPYGPGGATDIIARHLANKLNEMFGQAFNVENRPGASGNIALDAPAATPKPIVDKLFNATVAVLSRLEMKERLAHQMLTVMLSKSPQDFNELVQKETREWGDFIRENKIKID